MSCKIIYNNQDYTIESFKEFLNKNKNLFIQDFISQDIEGFKEFVGQVESKELKPVSAELNQRNPITLLPKVLYHGSSKEIIGELDKNKKREGYRESWHFTDNLEIAKLLYTGLANEGKIYQIDATTFKTPYYYGDLNDKVNSEDIQEYGFTESLLPKTNKQNQSNAVNKEYPIIDEISDKEIQDIKEMGYDIIIGRGNISIGSNALEYIPLINFKLQELSQPTSIQEDKKAYMKTNEPKVGKVIELPGSLMHFRKAVGLSKSEINPALQDKIQRKIKNYNKQYDTAYKANWKPLRPGVWGFDIVNYKEGQGPVILPIIVTMNSDFNIDNAANGLGLDKTCN